VTLLPVLAILFIATLIRSAFGFGEALVAVPLLAFYMPVDVAAPVAVLLSITIAAVIIAQDWRDIHFRSALLLIAATVVGTPFGLLLLVLVPPAVVKGLLATIIILFSSYALLRRSPFVLRNDRFAWLFGLLAGVMGGAYGMNGPPLVIYGTLRRWLPHQLRATLQGYFLPASIIIMGGYWFAGLWTPTVNRYYLWSLPGVAAGILLGRIINQRLSSHTFLIYVHCGLIVTGLALLWQSFL